MPELAAERWAELQFFDCGQFAIDKMTGGKDAWSSGDG